MDFANGHVFALQKLDKKEKELYIYNLGTGKGCSILGMVKGFEKAIGKK